MKEDLLKYFNEELSHLRKLSQLFADKYPQLAHALQSNITSMDDPSISYLVQAFAFLTARINRRLDHEAPEIANSLINVLYPHYLRPIPSMSILKINPAPLKSPHTITQHTSLITSTQKGEVYFRTVYPVTLWPITIKQIQYFSRTEINELSLLKMILTSDSNNFSWAQLSSRHLRFYINTDFENACAWFELFMSKIDSIQLKIEPETINTINLDYTSIRGVGYAKDEGMIPYPNHSFLGFRLLTEYFNFPEKFMFFDFIFPEIRISRTEQDLELNFYFNKSYPQLEKSTSKDTLVLGCTPIVNLFHCRGKPIPLLREKTEYHVLPDHSNVTHHTEIHSIQNIIGHSNKKKSLRLYPFYGDRNVNFNSSHLDSQNYWNELRKPSSELCEEPIPGNEIFISIVSNEMSDSDDSEWNLHLDLLCSNRDLPQCLSGKSKNNSDSNLYLWQNVDDNIQSMNLISRITRTSYFTQQHNLHWNLITHLSLNHLFYSDNLDGIEHLKKVLTLYNSPGFQHNIIKSLKTLNSRIITIRHPSDFKLGLCQGNEITLELNEDALSIPQSYLFGTILSHFFSQSCSLNSFVQLIITTQHSGEIARWKPFLGNVPVL